MLATLRNTDRRRFEPRAGPLISPSPNWPGECRTDRGCSLAESAPAPRWTRREGRSGPPAPLRKLLLRVSVCLDASVFPPRLERGNRGGFQAPTAAAPNFRAILVKFYR